MSQFSNLTPPGQPPMFDPSASPPRKRLHPLAWVGIGCGGIVLLMVILVCGGVLWLASGPEGGVRLGNRIEPYAVEYLAKHKIVEPDENVIAYYDNTISLDGTDAAILTQRRLIYHFNGMNTVIPVDQIVDVRSRDAGVLGTIIEVEGEDGTMVKIEIAPLNDAPAFMNALESQRRQKP